MTGGRFDLRRVIRNLLVLVVEVGMNTGRSDRRVDSGRRDARPGAHGSREERRPVKTASHASGCGAAPVLFRLAERRAAYVGLRARISRHRRGQPSAGLAPADEAILALIFARPLLPAQLSSPARRVVSLPIRRLLAAVLENGVHAFLAVGDRHGEKEEIEAEEWILARDMPSPFSFSGVCLDEQALRHRLFAMKGIPRKEAM